jgi:hypothetical protein
MDPTFRHGELYDLQSDLAESVNLYSKQPELITTLAGQLESWSQRTQDNVGMELAQYAQTHHP